MKLQHQIRKIFIIRIFRNAHARCLDFELALLELLQRCVNRFSSGAKHGMLLELVGSDGQHDFRGFIKRKLERFPYWLGGHLRLGQLALSSKDIALAYGSAQALIVSDLSPAQDFEAKRLLARCYLARGFSDKAGEILKLLRERAPQNSLVAEDYAAALMAAGKDDEARATLEKFSENSLSPAALAVRRALAKR